MAELLDTLRSRLDSSTIEGLSRSLGADSSLVRRVISMAVPMLVAGLSKNTDDPGGRRSLDDALRQDHDGSLLDSLGSLLGSGGGGGGGLGGLAGAVGGLLGGGNESRGGDDGGLPRGAADGEGILRHVLGDRRRGLEESASKATGMDRSQVSQVLAVAAPLVMSALGRVKRERDLSADGVAELVDRERRELESATPDAGEGDLRRVLDEAGGGDASAWLERLGTSLGGAVTGSDTSRS